MKVTNQNQYFGAACTRHVVRGCGDEAHLFGMLSPRAWAEAQGVFRRNPEDLPPGWLQEQMRPPKPVAPPNMVLRDCPLAPAVAVGFLGLVLGFVVGFALASGGVDPSTRSEPPPTVVHLGRSTVVQPGPIVVIDDASGHRIEVAAGAVLGLPELD